MKMTILPAALFTIVGLFSSTSQANPQSYLWSEPLPAAANIQLARSNGQSLNEAVRSVKKETGGRILSAKTINENGKRIHKIKVLLPSKKVRVFKINAQ